MTIRYHTIENILDEVLFLNKLKKYSMKNRNISLDISLEFLSWLKYYLRKRQDNIYQKSNFEKNS